MNQVNQFNNNLFIRSTLCVCVCLNDLTTVVLCADLLLSLFHQIDKKKCLQREIGTRTSDKNFKSLFSKLWFYCTTEETKIQFYNCRNIAIFIKIVNKNVLGDIAMIVPILKI
jgi:hypothetical protein